MQYQEGRDQVEHVGKQLCLVLHEQEVGHCYPDQHYEYLGQSYVEVAHHVQVRSGGFALLPKHMRVHTGRAECLALQDCHRVAVFGEMFTGATVAQAANRVTRLRAVLKSLN